MMGKSRSKPPNALLGLELTTIAHIVLLFGYNWTITGKAEPLAVGWDALFLVLVLCTTRLRLDWGQLVIAIIFVVGVVYSGYQALSSVMDKFYDWTLAWDVFSVLVCSFQLFLLWHPSSTQWLLIENDG